MDFQDEGEGNELGDEEGEGVMAEMVKHMDERVSDWWMRIWRKRGMKEEELNLVFPLRVNFFLYYYYFSREEEETQEQNTQSKQRTR